MNHGVKRYRQTNIMESFAFSKRPKSTLMESSRNNQLPLVIESSLNESPSEDLTNLPKSVTNGQASNNRNLEKSPSSPLREAFCNTSDTKNKNEICDAATILSTSVIDQLWATEDIETKVKNHQATSGSSVPKSMIDQSSEKDEGSYRSSVDLFPEDSPLESDPVPSSSGSQELFDSQKELFESQSSIEEPEVQESSSESDEDDTVVLNRSPTCDLPLPKLEPLDNHSIMFSPHIRPGDAPLPYPRSYRDKWDSDHVRMPCSPLNRYPVENSNGETVIGSRWDLICQSLMNEIETSEELEAAIMKYNLQQIGKWNFLGLHFLINEIWSEEERDHFFEEMLPAMIEMALSLPTICTQPVPLLKKNKDHYVTMSQKQIGCLLLNAFFCTFPRRNPRNKLKCNSEYASYPDINFNRLFFGTKRGIPSSNVAKLKCLFNYFRRIISEEPSGTVTFHRQVIPVQNLPNWYSSNRGIRTAVIKSHGFIEDDGHGLLQVDFANKFVGGGVLGHGCVQEEIRFVCSPELIVSRLFVEMLEFNEALIITGAEQYNKYSGYSSSFKWEGDFRDNTPRDSWGRRCTEIVAIDAINFRKTSDQFTFQNLKRELNKAYCGFSKNIPVNNLPAVATGNWGCGAFKGSATLKFLIQLMAASECGRSLLYFTFHDKKLKKQLQDMYEFLSDKNLTVGDLWRLLTDYCNRLAAFNSEKEIDLYHFIYSRFVTKKVPCQQDNRNNAEQRDSFKNAIREKVVDIDKSCSQDSEDIT